MVMIRGREWVWSMPVCHSRNDPPSSLLMINATTLYEGGADHDLGTTNDTLAGSYLPTDEKER